MIATYPLRAITHAPHARAIIALLAAALAVLIDAIFRFSDYRDLLHLLPVAGTIEVLGRPHAGLPPGGRPLLSHPSPPETASHDSLPSFCFRFSRPILLLADARPVHDQHRPVSRPECQRRQFRRRHLKLLQPAYLLVYSPLCTRSIHADFRSLQIHRSKSPSHSASCQCSTSSASNYALFLYAAEGNFHLNPLTSILRTTLHYEFETLREYHGPREDLPTFRASRRPLNSIIYVIDESIRGSNLSLNGYLRATTPFLQSLEARGRLKNLGICVAAGTFSHISNAYLITGHNAFPDDAFRTFEEPNPL